MNDNTPQLEKTIDTIEDFRNPGDERKFLHTEIRNRGIQKNNTSIAMLIQEYKKLPVGKVLADEGKIKKSTAEELVKELVSHEHSRHEIIDFLGLVERHGIYNTLHVVGQLNNPHLEDDLHRFLVQYLVAGHEIPGITKGDSMDKALGMKLYSVTFPRDAALDFKGLAGYMERFLAEMQQISSGEKNKEKIYFSLELALSEDSDFPVFYVAIPNASAELFEDEIKNLYRGAEVQEAGNDYNIFTFSGAESGSYAKPQSNEVFPIRTHDMFSNDSMPRILDVLRRMKKEGEGAAIQIVCAPVGDMYIKKYWRMLEDLKRGKSTKDLKTKFARSLADKAKNFVPGLRGEEKRGRRNTEDVIRNITRKLDYTIFQTNIRIITSAENQKRADVILRELESSFGQFDDVRGNGFDFERPSQKELKQLFRDFSFRIVNDSQNFPLNLREIASIYHFIR